MSSASKAEIEGWVQRIEEVTEAIQDILQEDPMEALQRKAAREGKQREEKERLESERLAKIKIRYEPKYYNRFDHDDVIDAMLKEVDLPSRKAVATHSHVDGEDSCAYFSRAEKVSLEEARRLKEEASTAVRCRDWCRAEELYTSAIQLQPVDDDLVTVLHNNRALTRVNLQKFLEALSDASFVLQREPNNVKALLRRAVALRHLHRPVEALKDVSCVLRLEPKNGEALVQHAWLRRAESELLESNQFLETNALKQTDSQPNPAERLCKAISLLSSPEAASKEALSSDFVVSLVETLRDVVGILQSRGMGACVFFAHRGGLLPTISVAQRLLRAKSCQEASSTKDITTATNEPRVSLGIQQRSVQLHAKLLIQLLHVLATVWEGSEISTQMVETEAVRDFLESLMEFLVDRLHSTAPSGAGKAMGEAAGPTCLTPVWVDQFDAVLQCLKSLTIRNFALVLPAVEGVGKVTGGLLPALWNSPYLQTSLTSGRVWVTLYYFVGWLDVLLKQGSSLKAVSFSTEQTLWSQLYSYHVTANAKEDEKKACIVLVAVMRIFSSSSKQQYPLPDSMKPLMQSTAAELALSLTSVVARSADQGVAGESFRLVRETLSSKEFTVLLSDMLQSVISRTKASPSSLPSVEDSRLLEALYAVVYNLILLDETRETYVRQWLDLPGNQSQFVSLTDQALNHLSAQGCDTSSCLTPLSARLLGVLAKFVILRDGSFRSSLCRREQLSSTLWRWLAAAVGVLRDALDRAGETPGEETALTTGVDRQKAKAIAWECLEHLTTILAALRKEICVVEVENIDLLVNLISLTPLRLTEASLHAMVVCKQEGDQTQQMQLHDETLAHSVASVVAIGNAALLISTIPFPHAPSGTAAALLLRLKAIDVLLQALRDARSSAHLIAREIAEMNKQKASLTDGVSHLQRWCTHLKAATKNLAISISRVCAIGGEPLKDRLRELNGFETLLTVQNNL